MVGLRTGQAATAGPPIRRFACGRVGQGCAGYGGPAQTGQAATAGPPIRRFAGPTLRCISTLLLSLALTSGDPATAKPPPAAPPAAESVETVEVPSMLIRIDEQVEVPAREAGVLADVNVREGQMVAQGAPDRPD